MYYYEMMAQSSFVLSMHCSRSNVTLKIILLCNYNTGYALLGKKIGGLMIRSPTHTSLCYFVFVNIKVF